MARQGRAGLGWLDSVVLFLAWVATAGLVYLLGVYVGKGMQERRLGLEERIVRLPVTAKPPPEGQRPKAESDLTFYDTLVPGSHPETAPARPEASPPATAPAPSAAGKVAEKAAAPPAAKATPPAATARSEPPAAPGAAGVPHSAPPPGVPARAAAVAEAPHPAALPRPEPAAAPPSGAGWTVEANPTRSREEAETLARQLKSRGYDTSVRRLTRDGDTWYRVRIGHYTSAGQAAETVQRLRDREGVAHAFVGSE